MKKILSVALFAASCTVLSAAPSTWYLNNVTFTDNGRAFGSFTYDPSTGSLSAINIQTTPAASTSSAASAIGGGNYIAGLAATPGVFVSGGLGTNVRRLQILAGLAALGGATNSVALAGTEGFCDATCTNLVGTQSRSIAAGQIVRASPTAPATWYMIATMDDGSQALGTFDFDPATGTYANVDVAITAGTSLTTSSRLKFSRPLGSSPTLAVFQTDQNVVAGSRVFVMSSPVSLVGGVGTVLVNGAGGGGSYQGACPTATTPSCPVAVPTNVVFGSIVPTAPAGFKKVVSQVADGGGWQTGLLITNTTDTPAPYALTFAQDDGTPFEIGGIGSFSTATVPPGGVAFVASTNPATLTQGSATLIGGHNFSVNAIYVSANANVAGAQQGSVTGDNQGAVSFSVPFDNTGGAIGGFAITNTSLSSVTVLVVAYDETGKVLVADSSITLAANGHTAFAFGSKPAFSVLANKRGLIRVFAIHPGVIPPFPGLNGLLLKFLPNGSFTTIAVTNR